MQTARDQTRKEVHAVEDENEMKASPLGKALGSATKDSRKKKRMIHPAKTRKRYHKSEGESECVSRKDLAIVPSGTPEHLGGKLAEGGNCCSETTVATSRELQLQTSEKVKLQLFPINESTRLRLENDGYNPFLELTLSPKKRIWSVIKHIDTKWGNKNGMFGEVFLFPYDINLDNLASYRRWSLDDTGISVVEVYRSLKCPAVFRLRYGWFSDHQLKHFNLPLLSTYLHTTRHSDVSIPDLDIEVNQMKESKIENKNLNNVFTTDEASDVVSQNIPSAEQVEAVGNQLKVDDIHAELVPWEDTFTNISIGGLLTEVSLLGKIISHDSKSESKLQPVLANSEISVGGLLSEVSLHGKLSSGGLNSEKKLNEQPLGLVATLHRETQDFGLNQPNRPPTSKMLRTKASDNYQPYFSWLDGTTSLSIGGLLFEASIPGNMTNMGSGLSGNNKSISSSTADSFDAFVASKLHLDPSPSKLTSHESRSSIFDAEDTCHAFPARKVSPMSEMTMTSTAESASHLSMKPLPHSQGTLHEDISSLGLKGIKWNDSLGPFDLGQPICLTLTIGDSRSANEFVK